MITKLKRLKTDAKLRSEVDEDIAKDRVDDNNNNKNIHTNNINWVSGDEVKYQYVTNLEVAVRCTGKYQLRPRVLQAHRRSDSEWKFQDSLKHKPRSLPLSRYRRKTANARERYRMRQINRAFDSLRNVLPAWVSSRRAATDMTKIMTLRLASAYIRSLQDILEGGEEQNNSWVLSSVLADAEAADDPSTQMLGQEGPLQEQRQCPGQAPEDSDLITLFCNTSDATVLQDNLEFSYLAPLPETEAVALLLESEPPRLKKPPPHAGWPRDIPVCVTNTK
ncbi:hypothetical protein Pcinc_000405 [Petrolisthes cinctipes]|uniref:BHLH domain-containing protein n=1 Tax=Petrolisthes cinctipes TaxID=88211 RepID=A0AAE1GND0_PETCI|nr:hypothetical protein Pcinc_000405 [Petrolisthes cinctipes]